MPILKSSIEDFLRYQKWNKRHSPHTLLNYESDLLQFTEFLETETSCQHPADIESLHIRSWLAHLKNDCQLKATSINRKKSSVQSFLQYLCRQLVITHNPAKALPSLRQSKQLPQYISQAQAEQLRLPDDDNEYSAFRQFTDELILELLYQCGLRRSEVISLQVKDIEFMMQQIRILGKGNKQRLVPVQPYLLDRIAQYLEERKQLQPEHAHLLILESGHPVYAQYVYRLVRKVLSDKSSIQRKSPHILRHSFATHLLENGANIQSIKELLGHSSLAATQVYTHLAIDKLKDIHAKNHPKG